MESKTTTLRITDEQLEIVDLMINLGVYKNRNEAFRDAVRRLIKKETKNIRYKIQFEENYGNYKSASLP